MRKFLPAVLAIFLTISVLSGQEESAAGNEKDKKPDFFSSATFTGLKLRSIGPAITSGRVADFAVDPRNRRRYFVAAASGGVWLTENAGTTWTPVFDKQSSYSIGALALDPNDPLTLWVGTGENNSQRSVSYGDGVYKSTDGGKNWKKMGLEKSEHIGRILVDPRDSNTVYVAAQGPLWGSGGDRGLYKTTDGGANWQKVLEISDDTGVGDAVMDPSNPDVLYASAYQRRRRVWTLIDGGPEGAIYKTQDAGATWSKLKNGLPGDDMGRIGLAVSPVDSDVVYALVEAAGDKGGVYRSRDRGANWEKRSGFNDTPFYYGEIVADPAGVDRIYLPGTFMMVSDDGGKTVRRLGEKFKHVDNHVIWIDPADTDFYRVGCDGGVYESNDRGENWRFIPNLPMTQFYNVAVDEAEPFYNVYGGTQDNFTLGGPSRTRNVSGIVNSDWFVVRGGDGFKVQIAPSDPDTVYAEAQYGALVRFDRVTGQRLGIQPVEGPGEDALRWNWDSPLLLSPHSGTRIYFAANKLFRSDDRGDTWTEISGELSRAIDPNTLPVMGKIWPPEAVGKGSGTSYYGNATALAESPLAEGLLYVGTDDGLIQVTENGGQDWRRQESFATVPVMSYVQRLVASSHSADRVFAVFDNHKNNDFRPYLVRSDNRGQDWVSITGDLPENGPVLAFAEDPVKPDLYFAGTEFGLFFSIDAGTKWVPLKGGLPTIAVRDLVVQRQWSDLALATFGRGFYILDDIAPLREIDAGTANREAALFPVRDALLYIEASPLGGRGKSFQGSGFYTADNPPFGAILTYFLKEDLRSLKATRKEAEKKLEKDKEKKDKEESVRYPTLDEFRKEAEEKDPTITVKITDADGQPVRVVHGSTSKGIHRLGWDLRYAADTVSTRGGDDDDDDDGGSGPLVLPGQYTATLYKTVAGETSQLGEPRNFKVSAEGSTGLSVERAKELEEFQRQVSRLRGAVEGAVQASRETNERIEKIQKALKNAPGASSELRAAVNGLEKRLGDLSHRLRGDEIVRRYGKPQSPSIRERVNQIVGDQRFSTAPPTQTHRRQYDVVDQEFADLLKDLRLLIEVDLPALDTRLDAAGVPWTPGRLPTWPPR